MDFLGIDVNKLEDLKETIEVGNPPGPHCHRRLAMQLEDVADVRSINVG